MTKTLGARRDVLEVQIRSLSPDGQGGASEYWVTFDDMPTIYASVEDIGGSEAVRATQRRNVTQHRIRTAYCAHLFTTMRLVGNNRVYTIEAVLDPTGRKEHLELIASSAPF